MNTNNSVDVVIPHYGDDKMLEACISSFENDESLNMVHVIDNNKENRGFTAGVNEGIKQAWGSQASFIAIVNNDTVAMSSPFYPMINLMLSDPMCAITGPKIVSEENPDRIIHAGGLQAFPNGIHKSGLVSLGQCNEVSREQWLSFVVVMIRKEALLRVGLLDEKMFLIGSDSDWCFRARYSGFNCAYVPESLWSHKGGESSGATSENSSKIQRRDMYRFWKKWIASEGNIFQELSTEVV
jgi:GT2 family glycosyltransferase